MRAFLDISGKRFGRLTVISRVTGETSRTAARARSRWLCRCDCGKDKIAHLDNLRAGRTRSCGCFRNTQGGHSHKHPLWKRWSLMLERCSNPNAANYRYYGGRGIKVCERWHSFPLFLKDVEASFREGTTIDRIDVNGDYTPSNFRWATDTQQARNKRNTRKVLVAGGELPLAEAAEKAGISIPGMAYRALMWPRERRLIASHKPRH